MGESGPLGVLLKASVGDAARFCASRDRQSTGNSRSKPHGPKTRASCVVVQNVPLGALISKRAAAAPGRRKCHPCLTEPPPQKAPDRRGGGARRVGSARARAARSTLHPEIINVHFTFRTQSLVHTPIMHRERVHSQLQLSPLIWVQCRAHLFV